MRGISRYNSHSAELQLTADLNQTRKVVLFTPGANKRAFEMFRHLLKSKPGLHIDSGKVALQYICMYYHIG